MVRWISAKTTRLHSVTFDLRNFLAIYRWLVMPIYVLNTPSPISRAYLVSFKLKTEIVLTSEILVPVVLRIVGKYKL